MFFHALSVHFHSVLQSVIHHGVYHALFSRVLNMPLGVVVHDSWGRKALQLSTVCVTQGFPGSQGARLGLMAGSIFQGQITLHGHFNIGTLILWTSHLLWIDDKADHP
jgi:hypothetical protein